MWFYKGVKVNILATTQKTAVAQIYKINSVQITTIIAEKHRQFVKIGIQHIRKYPNQNCEIFSPIVKANWHLFSSTKAIVAQIV